MNANDKERYLDDMVDGYAECAVWAGLEWPTDQNKEPQPLDNNYSTDDIAPEAMASIRQECSDFYDANADDLTEWSGGSAGHDFFLTRNGHGAGFWDRGLGAIGDRLSDAARVYGESDLYPADDGKLYLP